MPLGPGPWHDRAAAHPGGATSPWIHHARGRHRVGSSPLPAAGVAYRGLPFPGSDAPMIISQTPYRVSFSGGGTDLPAFYRQEYGAVLSTTIDQHIYVTIHRRFEPTIRVSYSRTEEASTIDEVAHELVREAMRRVEI